MSFELQSEQQASQIVQSQALLPPIEEGRTIMDLWRVLMKRRAIILLTAVIIFALAVLYAFRAKPVYESVSRVKINPNKGPNVGLESLVQEAQAGQDTTALQTEILVLRERFGHAADGPEPKLYQGAAGL
jgi:hypothetical protein